MKKEDIIIPVSSGELIDKISILKIKKKKILNKSKLKNINNELSLLNEIYNEFRDAEATLKNAQIKITDMEVKFKGIEKFFDYELKKKMNH